MSFEYALLPSVMRTLKDIPGALTQGLMRPESLRNCIIVPVLLQLAESLLPSGLQPVTVSLVIGFGLPVDFFSPAPSGFFALAYGLVSRPMSPIHVYIACCICTDVALRKRGLFARAALSFASIAAIQFAAARLSDALTGTDWARAGKLSFWALLILSPRLYFGSNVSHQWMPENLGGIWTALALFVCEALLRERRQWLVQLILLLYGLPPRSITAAESVAIFVAAWALGLHPAVWYAAVLCANVFVHPTRRRLVDGTETSVLLQRQRKATLLFLGTRWLLRFSGGHFSRVLSLVLLYSFWAVVAVSLVALVFVLSQNVTFPAESPRLEGTAPKNSQKYQYQSVAGQRKIRLLRVKGSLSSNGPLDCDIIQVDIKEAPVYVAISYRWDEIYAEKDSKEISINGYSHLVPPKVYMILKSVRSPIRARYVWIDSICINQNDVAEKTWMVANMRYIYGNCSYVFCWVGGSESEPFSEVEYFRRMWFWITKKSHFEAFEVGRILSQITHSRLLQDFSVRDSPELFFLQHDLESWKALERLVSESWFSRLWVIQEVAVARRVLMHYNGSTLWWNEYARAMAVLANTGVRRFPSFIRAVENDPTLVETPGIDNSLIMENIRSWYQSRGNTNHPDKLLSLEDTLKLCLRFQSTEQVDRIFAILGLISKSDHQTLGIYPDYDSDVPTIFTRVARLLLFRPGNSRPFRLLQFAGIGQPRLVNGLPSWVPDWTAGLPTCILSTRGIRQAGYHASGSTLPRIRLLEHAPILECWGTKVDSIAALVDLSTLREHTSQDFPFRDAIALARTHGSSPYRHTNQPIDEAFWRTIITDADPDGHPSSSEYVVVVQRQWQEYEDARDAGRQSAEELERARGMHFELLLRCSGDVRFAHLLASDLSRANPTHSGLPTSILGRKNDEHQFRGGVMTVGRQFCVTKEGYVGLVPALSEVGDTVVVFSGSPTPHVLRVYPPGAGRSSGREYRLVGESYIHGIMDGSVPWSQERSETFYIV